MGPRTLHVLFVDVLAVLLIHEVMFSECDLKTKTNNHHIKSYVQGFHRKERQAPPIDPSRMYLPPRADAVASSGFGAPNIETSNFGNNKNAAGYGELPLVTTFGSGTAAGDGDYGVSSSSKTTTSGGQQTGDVQTAPVVTQSYDSVDLGALNGSSSPLFGQRTSFVDTLASRGNEFSGDRPLNDGGSAPADYSQSTPSKDGDGTVTDEYGQDKSSTAETAADSSGWQTTQKTADGNRNSYGPSPGNFDGFPGDGYGTTAPPPFGRNPAANNGDFSGTPGNAYQQDAAFGFSGNPNFNNPGTAVNGNGYGQKGPQAGEGFNSQGDTTGYNLGASSASSTAQSYGQIDFIPSVAFSLNNNEFGAQSSGPDHYYGQTSSNNGYDLQGQQQSPNDFGPQFNGEDFVQGPSDNGYYPGIPPAQISNYGQTQTSSSSCGANGWNNNQPAGASNDFRSGYGTQNKKTDSTLVPKDQYKNSNLPNQGSFEKPVNNNRDYGEPAPNAFSNFAPGNLPNQPPPANVPDVQFRNSILPSRGDFEKPANNDKDYGEPAPNAFSNFAPGNLPNQPPPTNVPDVQYNNSISPSGDDIEKPANSEKDYGEPAPNAFSNFAPGNLPNQPLPINNNCDNHNNNPNKQTETVFSSLNTGY